jgi:nucleoside-diphosphate-sugar epimerase
MLFHVTGARGLVGQAVTSGLAELGDVHVTDVEDMDVTDLEAVRATLASRPPDVVVHLAGLKGNLPSREQPLKFIDVNTNGTVNLLEASRLLGVKHFVFFSSLTVHGPGNEPVDETSPLDPQHPYSGSKGASESIVRAYSHSYGMGATIFRPNFIVGPIYPPQPYADNLIYDFIQAIHDDGVIELAGEGQYQREWMHPVDIASAVGLAVSATGTGCETYILRGERVTMHDLATRIVQRVGKGRITTNPNRGGFSIISSSEKAERELGWKPNVDLNTLISEIWDEYQERVRTARDSNNGN